MTEALADNEKPERLDKWLVNHFKTGSEAHSRTYFQNLIDIGLVTVNGESPQKRQMIQAGDEIEVTFLEKESLAITPEDIPLDVLYEDEYLIAINKPAGMVVHPAPGSPNGTLVNACVYYLGKAPTEDPIRPGIVHRIDKETSGAILVAKNSASHEKLSELFAKRLIEKTYLAIALGSPPMEDTIDAPIGRDERNRQKMAVRSSGKRAVSHIERIKSDGDLSFVRIKIETGRTHQIRVHMRYIGVPILGDATYGNKGANTKYGALRQMLHAHKLHFKHPFTGKPLTIEAPLPEDFEAMLEKIS